MDILTPKHLQIINLNVREFIKRLEAKSIRLLELEEQYDLVLQEVKEFKWTCSAIKAQCHGNKTVLSEFIDVYEIYINVGYGCYICVYLDEELIELPTIGWSDLPRLGQNSFIGTHLDYYAQSNHFEIAKRED